MDCGLSLSHLGSEKGTPRWWWKPEIGTIGGPFKSKTVVTLEVVRGLAGIAARRVRALRRPSSGGWFDLAAYPDFLLTALLIFFSERGCFS